MDGDPVGDESLEGLLRRAGIEWAEGDYEVPRLRTAAELLDDLGASHHAAAVVVEPTIHAVGSTAGRYLARHGVISIMVDASECDLLVGLGATVLDSVTASVPTYTPAPRTTVIRWPPRPR